MLLAVLGLASGLRHAFAITSNPLHVLVPCKGGNAELTSLVTRESYQIIKSFPGIAKQADGQPMTSLEVVSGINLPSVDNPEGSNVTLRGLSPAGVRMRAVEDHLRAMVSAWSTRGAGGQVRGETLRECATGKPTAVRAWTLDGVRRDGWRGSTTDSDIFGDVNQVAADFNRSHTLSSALLQATDEVAATALIDP